MNFKIWIPLSAATVAGAAAAWAGYQLVSQRPAVAHVPQVQLDSVVVAARELPAGTQLTEADLSVLRVERGSLPGPTVAKTSELLGRVVSTAVGPGQPLSAALLSQDGTIAGLSATLPNGFRAITIHVDPYSGLDGFLLPEAHVDVIAALGSGNEAAARTVAQNVRVLAVAGRLRGESIEKTGEEEASLSNDYSVTLMVTPEQAAAIELACDSGTPRLMLRAGTDTELHPFLGMTLAELRGDVLGDPFSSGAQWEPVPESMVGTQSPEPAPETSKITPVAVETPAPAQPPKPVQRVHVVEVIRAGVISRSALPIGPTARPQPRPSAERAVVNNDVRPVAE